MMVLWRVAERVYNNHPLEGILSFQLGYRPPLDGLRGICVLMVIAYHASLPFTGGGFLGVDGFFVLSGFLITALLVQEWNQTSGIDLRAFYFRRLLRLMPALLALLVIGSLATLVLLPGESGAGNWRGIGYSLTYVSNWAAAVMAKNHDWAGILGWFNHTWSLAIEEQFYLLWPPLLLLLLKRRSNSTVFVVVSSLIAASVMLRLILFALGASSIRLYVGLDTRADALLIGCLLALVVSRYTTQSQPGLDHFSRIGVVCSSLVIFTLFALEQTNLIFFHVGGFTVVALAFAALILHLIISPEGRLARLLSFRPFVRVGAISYGLYLWHVPVFEVIALDERGWGHWEAQLLRIAVTFFFAIVSYRYLERPLLRLKKRLSTRMPREQWSSRVTPDTLQVAGS
jgi:peptidoglycan/LPS O-acetylase OafA/YrhL